MEVVRELIAFYESNGWDWRSAVAFTLIKDLGMLGAFLHPNTRYGRS